MVSIENPAQSERAVVKKHNLPRRNTQYTIYPLKLSCLLKAAICVKN